MRKYNLMVIRVGFKKRANFLLIATFVLGSLFSSIGFACSCRNVDLVDIFQNSKHIGVYELEHKTPKLLQALQFREASKSDRKIPTVKYRFRRVKTLRGDPQPLVRGEVKPDRMCGGSDREEVGKRYLIYDLENAGPQNIDVRFNLCYKPLPFGEKQEADIKFASEPIKKCTQAQIESILDRLPNRSQWKIRPESCLYHPMRGVYSDGAIAFITKAGNKIVSSYNFASATLSTDLLHIYELISALEQSKVFKSIKPQIQNQIINRPRASGERVLMYGNDHYFTLHLDGIVAYRKADSPSKNQQMELIKKMIEMKKMQKKANKEDQLKFTDMMKKNMETAMREQKVRELELQKIRAQRPQLMEGKVLDGKYFYLSEADLTNSKKK